MHDILSHVSLLADLAETTAWYNNEQPGLGDEFIEDFERTLAFITSQPTMYQQVSVTFRQAVLKRFPFSIYYSFEDGHIYILACLHNARERNRILKERT
jgi:hypothetical protein